MTKSILSFIPDATLVPDHRCVTTRNIVHEVGASPNTLKVTFRSFVGKGLLVRHGEERSIWYSQP
ncbi:MAG: hypothetical protein V7776_22160 [Halopseudomonas aestusnigri]